MNITVSVDTSKPNKVLTDFYDALVRAKLGALTEIGQEVQSRATRAFRTPAMRPAPWAPRKPTYIVTVNRKTRKKTRKLDDHPLLIKTGALRQSIVWELVSGDAVRIGTDRKYAGYHQLGTKHMPARPFLPVDDKGKLTPQMEQKVNRIIARHLKTELGKFKG